MRFIGNAPVDGEVRAIASGALATGDTVVVNSDGTVSVISGSSISENIGSPNSFGSNHYRPTPVYDPNSNKVVMAYTGSSPYYGTAVVGTISGTSISFGTPVVFNSAISSAFSGVFDPDTNKVIYNFKEDSGTNRMKTLVGTVSGTSISFGSAATLESQHNNGSTSAIAYDTVNNKVVSVYTQSNAPKIRAKVGTVSGTTISYGSYVEVNPNSNSASNYVDAVFDTNSGNVAIFWSNSGDSNTGASIAGTVSGTSITFGSIVNYSDAYSVSNRAAYDSVGNKVVVMWDTITPSQVVKAIVGTVSGTAATATISYGTAVDIAASSLQNSGSLTFDPNSSKVVAAWPDSVNSSYPVVSAGQVSGTSISFSTPTVIENSAAIYGGSTLDTTNDKVIIGYSVQSNYAIKLATYQPAYNSTNLTSENFVGFSNSGYASGQSAALNSTCSVDKNQSGLTAGQTYYVQTDGTLGTVADDPSVVAGTAISSNSIIVKG
jgi:hypothetical protein